jgi:hypothetical protein
VALSQEILGTNMKNQYFSMVCIESFITFLPIIITNKTFSQKTINFGIGPFFDLPGIKKGQKIL